MGDYRVLYSNGDWGFFPAKNYMAAKRRAKKTGPEGCSVLKVQKTTLEEGRDLLGYEIEFEITGRQVTAFGTRFGKKCTWHTYWPIFAKNNSDARERADEELERFKSNLTTRISDEGVVAGDAVVNRVYRKGKRIRFVVETRGGPEINWGDRF